MKSFNKIHYRPLFLLLFLSYFTISMNSCKEDIDERYRFRCFFVDDGAFDAARIEAAEELQIVVGEER